MTQQKFCLFWMNERTVSALIGENPRALTLMTAIKQVAQTESTRLIFSRQTLVAELRAPLPFFLNAFKQKDMQASALINLLNTRLNIILSALSAAPDYVNTSAQGFSMPSRLAVWRALWEILLRGIFRVSLCLRRGFRRCAGFSPKQVFALCTFCLPLYLLRWPRN